MSNRLHTQSSAQSTPRKNLPSISFTLSHPPEQPRSVHTILPDNQTHWTPSVLNLDTFLDTNPELLAQQYLNRDFTKESLHVWDTLFPFSTLFSFI